jgi:hypothetical protein
MPKCMTRIIMEDLKGVIDAQRPDLECRYKVRHKHLTIIGDCDNIVEIRRKADKVRVSYDRFYGSPNRECWLGDPGYVDQVLAVLAEYLPLDRKRARRALWEKQELSTT